MVDGSQANDASARLVEDFITWTLKGEDARAVDDFKGCKRATTKKIAIVKALDAIDPPGRMALLPLLEHPDMAVRAMAATYLCRFMPERVLPLLHQLANANTMEALSLPHALSASFTASNAIFFHKHGALTV